MSSPTFDVVNKSQFIRAGAGAGKTTRLIKTFIDFAEEFKNKNQRLPRVIITTFTRKATQEVKERLLVSALNANQKEIFEYISQKSYVHISTIHGLLSLFLNQFSEKIKFPQDIKIVEAAHVERTLKKQINELIKKKPEYLELLESYTFSQLVELANKAIEIRSQESQLGYVRADELKALAQQHKNKILETLDKIFNLEPSPHVKWTDYFDYLKKIYLFLKNNDEKSYLELLELTAPKRATHTEKTKYMDDSIYDLIVDLKDNLLDKTFDSLEFIEQHEKLNSLFLIFVNDLYQVLFEYKRRTGELTMSDLETLSLQVIEQYPEAAQEFSDSWDYFMIDEYQDTSPLQVKILDQLIQNKTCFIVGDPQQSIYLFRGARSEVFNAKKNEMEQKNASVDFLDTNYRSEPSLMNFINDFFKKFSPQFQTMQIKSNGAENKKIKFDSFYVKCPQQAVGALKQVQSYMAAGVEPQDICILSRNNKNLIEVALLANKIGINVQLQTSSGFESKREILDLISFNKFLNNPHDDENFITLVRSPWFYISDAELLNLAQMKYEKKCSYWAVVLFQNHALKENLVKYLNLFNTCGISYSTQQFILNTDFVSFSDFYDPTGKREANIFKYLNSLMANEQKTGFSLGQYLEDQFESISLESGAANSEAQPVLQPNCISLMTVHASKGLQFKHVIVLGFADMIKTSITPDLSFDSSSKKMSLAIHDDEIGGYVKTQWAKQLRDEFAEREKLESDRVLYVAMTRAIESLTLVAKDDGSTIKSNTWYAKISWPLEGEYQEDNFNYSSIKYDEQLDVSQWERQTPVQLRQAYLQPAQQTLNETQSITELLNKNKNSQSSENYQYEQQLKNLKKAQYGTDLHRIFEAMKYLDLNKILSSVSENEKLAIQYLLNVKEINILELLKLGHNEWGFGLKTSKKFIQGQIDLWAEVDDKVHVLDYKTGSSQYADKAFQQLQIYAKALYEMKAISQNKKLCLSVVYPVEKNILQQEYNNFEDFNVKNIKELSEIF